MSVKNITKAPCQLTSVRWKMVVETEGQLQEVVLDSPVYIAKKALGKHLESIFSNDRLINVVYLERL